MTKTRQDNCNDFKIAGNHGFNQVQFFDFTKISIAY